MDKYALAERLKYARTVLRSLSMQALAELSGVAASTVQRYETAQINKIKLPVVESFARVLCVNVHWLMGEDVPMEQPDLGRNYGMVNDIASLLDITGIKLVDADLNGNFRLARGDEAIAVTLEDMDEIIKETREFALCSILEHSYRRKKLSMVINEEKSK